MTDIPSPSPVRPANTQLRSLVNIGCLVAIAIWAISVVSLFSALSTANPALSWATVMIAVLGAPLLFVFVLPALIYNRWGGPSGPKVGATLLICGLIAAVAIMIWPSMAPMFR